MPSGGYDEVRDYGFADRALALRKRAGLTQGELAALLGVSLKAVGGWEAGLYTPSAERLEQLIALYAARGALGAEGGAEEAAALWEAARTVAHRRLPPFDPRWFASLGSVGGATLPAAPVPPAGDGAVVPAVLPTPDGGRGVRHDWGEAPYVPVLAGRREELALLEGWVREGQSRVVQVLGAGGIGKTALAARLARNLAPEFEVVYWRSLRNAPPPEEWLAGAISALSAARALPPEGLEARLTLALGLLREQRALLVLDNLETILEPEAVAARYREGYEGYGEALRRLAEGGHRGCLLLTSREQPLRADEPAVQALHLGGLGVGDGRALLTSRGLAGDGAAWAALVVRYGGNPLALRVVSETIEAVFGGDIAAFLAEAAAVFGGIRELLDEQVTRLSALERAVGIWLAVEREPVGFAELAADVGPGVPRVQLLEAVEGLRRRSLLEHGARGTFTLQPVVLEYATALVVGRAEQEVLAGEPSGLQRYALVKAQAKDYVRRSQERLIAAPLLERLRTSLGSAAAVERRLLGLLDRWRGVPTEEQGYGSGNVVNLLRLARGDLRGLDLSRLAIRQAYLQEVEMQDASLVGAHLSEAVLAEAFNLAFRVALSADGAYLAAGTTTGEVRVWRVADRMPLLALPGHTGAVFDVALSGDGRLLASGGGDGTVRLWQAKGGQPLATLLGHSGLVWGVALSGDGRLLASGGNDGTVRLWEAEGGRALATLQGHTGLVWGVALSGDGRTVASGGHDGTVRLWEAEGGRALATLQAHTGLVLGVALSADGRTVASGGSDGTVRLWEAEGGRALATLQGHTGLVLGVALSADGRTVASGGHDGTVRLWEAEGGRALATLQAHTGGVWSVALSGDGRLLASGGSDGTVRLWEAEGGRALATLQGHAGGVWSVALSGDGRLLASGSDGTVRLWEAEGGRALATLQGHTGLVFGVALSGDGRTVASGGHDGTVRLWAAQQGREATPSGRLLATPLEQRGQHYSAPLSGDGRLLASGSDGTVRLWEAEGGRALATLQGHTGLVLGVALSGDGRTVASAGSDGAVRLWEAEGGRALATLQGHTGQVFGVALSGDGRTVASGGDDGTVRLWEAEGGRALATLQGHTGGVWSVALSGDGRTVASGGSDGTVRLWEAEGGRALATLQGHTGLVFGVALSGDGRTVASGGDDGTVRLWEAEGGRALATLQGHTGGVRAVALSGDGRLLASGGYDGTVRLWEVSSGACLRVLQAERRYERLDITGLTGVTEAQRAALLALGAVEGSS